MSPSPVARPQHYRRVLVGTDGSSTADTAVDRALDVARAHGAHLTVLAAGRRAEEVVAAEEERLGDADVDFVARTVNGDPANVLAIEAREGGHDLLVVGNKGLAGLRRLNPLGSVPGKLSHHLPCSLLVVKTT